MELYGLDEIDKKILQILQEDGRITVLDLAERVGLSPTPCGRRLRSLEERGFVERYVALLRPKSLGLHFNAFIAVRLNRSHKDEIERFVETVRSLDEIQEAYFITGDYDYLLHVRTESPESFKEFLIDRILSLAIVQTQTYIVLEQAKHTTALPLSGS